MLSFYYYHIIMMFSKDTNITAVFFSWFLLILYLKFKMSNDKIVFLSRVIVILPGISVRKWDSYCISLLKWDTVNISCWHGNYTQLHARLHTQTF